MSVALQVGGGTKLAVAVATDAADATLSAVRVRWSSSDTDVAVVDADGVVAGVGAGTAIITARSPDGTTGTETVVVTDAGLGYFFPGITTQKASLGDYAALDAAAKLTVSVWFVPLAIGGGTYGGLWSRYNDTVGGDTKDQIWVGRAANACLWQARGASANAVGTTATTGLLLGTAYKITFVFDGTETGDANRLKAYLSTLSAGTWSTDSAETITFTGEAIPAALTTAASSTDMKLGGSVGAFSAFFGHILGVRVWRATALTITQVRAETLVANPVAASLNYALHASMDNTGGDAGQDGTPTSLVIPIVYDAG